MKPTDAFSAGMPRSNPVARSGAELLSAAAPGCSAAKNSPWLARKGRITGKVSDRGLRALGPFEIVSWRNGRATFANALIVRVEVGPQLGLLRSDRRDDLGGACLRGEETIEAGGRVGDRRQHRHRVADQRHEQADGRVDVLAATGEGVAEAAQVLLVPDPRRVVEHVEELVELDRLHLRCRERDRAALGEALRSDVPRVTSTYFRPSEDRGRMMIVESIGSGLMLGLELQVELGRTRTRPASAPG